MKEPESFSLLELFIVIALLIITAFAMPKWLESHRLAQQSTAVTQPQLRSTPSANARMDSQFASRGPETPSNLNYTANAYPSSPVR